MVLLKYDYQGKFEPKKLAKNNIDRLSLGFIPNKAKVLELGCATGFMSRYLKDKKHCQVIGVDINSLAKPDIVGDLDDQTTWQQINHHQPFDVVFASSILEHLPRPESTLQLIKAVLRPKGLLIATAPNVAHWRMRLKLLLGRWQYEDYGLLDRTHLRFFTYFNFLKWIESAGFKILVVAIDPAGGIKYLNWLIKRWPNLYAHQLCVKAQR